MSKLTLEQKRFLFDKIVAHRQALVADVDSKDDIIYSTLVDLGVLYRYYSGGTYRTYGVTPKGLKVLRP